MKMKDFPLLLAATVQVDMENCGSMYKRMGADPEKHLPMDWNQSAIHAESVLVFLKGKKVKDIMSKPPYAEIGLEDDVTMWVISGMDDAAQILMTAAGLNTESRDALESFLGEYFDGELDVIQYDPRLQVRKLK